MGNYQNHCSMKTMRGEGKKPTSDLKNICNTLALDIAADNRCISFPPVLKSTTSVEALSSLLVATKTCRRKASRTRGARLFRREPCNERIHRQTDNRCFLLAGFSSRNISRVTASLASTRAKNPSSLPTLILARRSSSKVVSPHCRVRIVLPSAGSRPAAFSTPSCTL